MEQYIALIPDDIKPGIVNPKIDTDDEEAYEHVRTILEIVDLFHFTGVTHDAIMLRVFLITLKGRALRWKNRLPAGTITTWDLLKKDFVWRYCHPFITAKKLEGIYNFKQERDETLYHAWERYNDLLYQCPLHDLNCQQKVHIFYTGLDISTRKILDSNRKRINDVLDNVDAIHESFKGEHLTKEYPLKKEDEAIMHSRYMESLEETIIKFCEDTIKKQTVDDERLRKIFENTESNIRALKTTTKNLQEKAYQLTHKVLTNTREKVKAITTMGKENMKEPVPRDLSPTPFLGHLKEQMGSPYRTRETVRMIGNPEEIHNAKAQEDEGDMDVGWDITSKDVERLRQFLTPTMQTLPNLKPVVQPYIPLGPVHDKDKIIREKEQDYDIPLNDRVMQPLTSRTIHITPPDDDYVAPATNPMSNKKLNKFEEKFSNITKVAKKEYDNPVIKTYDCETFLQKLLHQDPAARRHLSRPARPIIMW
ncbi:Orf y [Tanacetum coccineum]